MGAHDELRELDRLDRDDTIASRLARWARVDPDRPAIEDADGVTTYAELDRVVGAVAGWLRRELVPGAGAAEPAVVGVLTDRARSTVVASMAVARAGLVSVAIDPAFPPARRDAVMADAGIVLVLTDRRDGPAGAVDLRACTGADAIEQVPIEPGRRSSIIYTSGSTGVPKGVEYSHGARLAISESLPRDTSGPGTRCGVVNGGSSGGAEGVQCIPLVMGGTLVPYDVGDRGLRDLVPWLRARRITTIRTVPTVLRQLASGLPPGERLDDLVSVALFGEQLHWAEVPRLRSALGPGAVLHNTYGSSEAGIVTSYPVTGDAPLGEGPVPVGRPVPGRQVVLDGDELVAIGDLDRVPGAYRRRPELTAERFGTSSDGRRTCRTGDRAWLDDDGNVHLGGRLDDVVKIAGVRVGLAEVEAALAGLDHVSGAAAVTRTDRHGDLRLHAFVTVDRSDVDRRELRTALEGRLPRAMLPDTITPIEELPRLPAGKVDRNALADARPDGRPDARPDGRPDVRLDGRPDARVDGRRDAQVDGRLDARLDGRPDARPVGSKPAPVPTGIEPRLAAIWAAAVDRPPEDIGPDDDFFDLGGDSLRATRMFTDIDRALGVGLPVATLLTAPTLRSLDGAVRAAVAGRPVWSRVVEIRPPVGRTTRPALIVLHDGLGQIMGARRLAGHLPPDQPIWAVAPDELTGRPTPARSLEELAAAYLRELHAVVPDRPWVLFGPSFGGSIAFEIARQAGMTGEQSGRASGRESGRQSGRGEVALVVLGDTVAPGRESPWTGRRPGASAAIVARRRRETRDLPLVERVVHAVRGTLRLAGGAVRRWLRDGRGQWDGLRLRAVIARGRPVPLDLRERLITDRCIAMAERYPGGDLPGEVLYVASTNGDPGSPAVWAGWSGTFRRIDVPAPHHDMLRDPALAVTAEILDRELARLATDAPAPQPSW